MKKILAIMVALYTCHVQAQVIPEFTQTPSTESMVGNSLTEADEFRGKVNINIPLFTMSLGNKEIPFSLYYNTGGVKVEENGSNIGMNWNFTGESKIVRKQNGLPDDLRSYIIAKPNRPYHMTLLYMQLGWTFKEATCLKLTEVHNVGYMYSYNIINTDINNYNTNFSLVNTRDVYLKPEAPFDSFPSAFSNNAKYIEKSLDTAPDEFTVFLPDGTTFTFMFDYASGQMKGLNSDKYKITHSLGTNGIEGFSVTDPNGVSYSFYETEEMHLRELTGELEADVLPYTKFETVENKPLSSLNICNNTSGYLIDQYKNRKHPYAWHLSKISSNETFIGEEINFEYDNIDILNISYPRTYMIVNKSTKNTTLNKNYVYKSWINTKQLKRISNNITQIDFLYSDFRQDLISAGNFTTSKVLSGIGIYDKKQLLYPETKIIFKNDYVVSTELPLINVDKAVYKRLFLNDIEFYWKDSPNGLFNKYSFMYYNASSLPNKHSLATDMFGYYKGGTGKRFPQLYYYSSWNQFSPVEGRFSPYSTIGARYTSLNNMVNVPATDFESTQPNAIYSYYGALRSINNIHGKETILKYENNSFVNHFSNTVLSGGIRIKALEEKDVNSSSVHSKNFTYNNNSQGYMENVPVLAYESKEISTEYLHISNKPFNYLANFNTYYPRVKTTEGNGEYGYQINMYSYYNDLNINNIIPSYIPINNRFYRIYNTHNDTGGYNLLNPSIVPHHFDFLNTTLFPFIEKTDYSGINGYKETEELYDSNNNIVKRKSFEYNINNSPYKRLNTGDLHGGYELQYYFRMTPKLIIDKDYTFKDGFNNYLENKTTLSFDNYQNVIKEVNHDHSGNELKAEYTYAYNYPSSNTEMTRLSSANLISNYITKKSSFNNEELYLEKRKFGTFQRRSFLIERTLQKNEKKEYTTEKINSYENGKIVEYTDKGGNVVSVIWGYENTLPVAEAIGVRYDQIKLILPQINLTNLNLDSFDILRNQFPDALITNYTYMSATSKLLTGKKEPNEQKIFYYYNNKGKLFKVVDEYNNTLETYEYNFLN